MNNKSLLIPFTTEHSRQVKVKSSHAYTHIAIKHTHTHKTTTEEQKNIGSLNLLRHGYQDKVWVSEQTDLWVSVPPEVLTQILNSLSSVSYLFSCLMQVKRPSSQESKPLHGTHFQPLRCIFPCSVLGMQWGISGTDGPREKALSEGTVQACN